MPLCLRNLHPFSSPIFLRLPPSLQIHLFSTITPWSAASHNPTYYEILNVPITATTEEIKKQFYVLSLAHHPDKNPKDPNASARFASLSSAYQVLSNAAKRAKYDHEHQIHRPSTSSPSSCGKHLHRGSYLGSRPPSGLSKRRGPFRGPPPSFYAHGGYDAGRRQHPQSQSGTGAPPGSYSSSSATGEPSPNPALFIYHNPVSHFNAHSHFQTQSREDARRRLRRIKILERERAQRRARGLHEDDGDGSVMVRFLVVMGILGVAGMAAGLSRRTPEISSGPRSPGSKRFSGTANAGSPSTEPGKEGKNR